MQSKKDQFLFYLKNMIWLLPIVSIGYVYTNWRSDQIARSFEIYADFELKMPFVPWAQYFYALIIPYLFFPPLVLKKPSLAVLHKQLIIGSLISFAFFYIFPSSIAFVRVEPQGGLLEVIYSLDRQNNASFSLYQLYLWLIAFNVSQAFLGFRKVCFIILTLVVSLSGPLIWQQHLIGILMAWIVVGILILFIKENADQA